MNNKKLFRS